MVSFNPRWLDAIVFPYSDIKGLPIRFLYLAYSMLLCFLILVAIKLKQNWNNYKLSTLGKDTLFFYLLHPYILYGITFVFWLLNVRVNVAIAILITAITVFMLISLRRIELLYKLLR